MYRVLSGVVESVSIYGPRRTGKTSLLNHDFVPFAEQNGHRAIYTKFWRISTPPIITLLRNLEKSANANSFVGRLTALVGGFAVMVRLKTPGDLAEVGVKMDSASRKKVGG